MSFGGGLAAGIGTGIGAGIAMGISSGRKKAATEMRDYIKNNSMIILDRSGKPVKLDQFIEDAVSQPSCDSDTNHRATAWFLLAGLLILGLVAAVGSYLIIAN